MFFGSRRAMKSVAAAEVAALGAWRALAAGDRVGGIVFGETEQLELAPHRSRNRVLRLLHEIARLNRGLAAAPGTNAPVTLNAALEAALRHKAHDQLVVLISDLDGADARTEQLATELAAHNDVLVIAIYDPLGSALVARPGMIADLGDGYCQLPLDPQFPAAFRREFERLAGEWTRVFHALRVPVLPVSAAESPVEQLRSLFGHQRVGS
jgi:uncharacterized protein (DUF58 family)